MYVKGSATALQGTMCTVKAGEFARMLCNLAAMPVRRCRARKECSVDGVTSDTSQPPGGDVHVDGLVIRPTQRLVERDGVPIGLSANEFDLLYFLASHPRQVFTREELLQRVWHYAYVGDSRPVTVQMSRLRKKVEPDPGQPRLLRTVWRVGYKFMP